MDDTNLIQTARAAYEQAKAQSNTAVDLERGTEIIRIREHLAKLGLEPAGDPFPNWVSNRVCVPLVAPGWDTERETQIHAVAAEWDHDAHEHGPALVADGDCGDDWHSRRLYPAGRLTGLADIGHAIEHGGRPVAAPVTVADHVRAVLSRATASSDDASGVQTCLEAVCLALLDIAGAIRETGAPATL